MSGRRIARSRRFGAAVLPPPEAWYSLGVTVDYDADISRVTKDGSNRISSLAHRGTAAGFTALAQGAGASQPLWVNSDTPSGRACIHADTLNRHLTSTTISESPGASQTIFMVAKVGGGAGGYLRWHNGAATVGWQAQTSAGNRLVTTLGPTVVYTDGAQGSSYEVWAWRLSASGGFGTAVTTSELYINGALVSLAGGPGTMTAPTATFTIFMPAGGASAKIARVMVAPATLLSVSETSRLSRSLMNWAGL